jgi:hypothetical protein
MNTIDDLGYMSAQKTPGNGDKNIERRDTRATNKRKNKTMQNQSQAQHTAPVPAAGEGTQPEERSWLDAAKSGALVGGTIVYSEVVSPFIKGAAAGAGALTAYALFKKKGFL